MIRAGAMSPLSRHLMFLALLFGAAAFNFPAGARAQQTGSVTLGASYPLSGPESAWGRLLLPAIEIAVEHRNAASGAGGRQLVLVVEDSGGRASGGVAAFQKLVRVDRAIVILSVFTNVVSAQMRLAERFQVPIISPVEAPGLVAQSNWAFAHSPEVNRIVPLLANQWRKRGVKKLFAFYPNTPIAKLISPIVQAEAAKIGAEYEQDLFGLDETDFRALVTRARRFQPDAFFIMGHGTPNEGLLMKQIRTLGATVPIYSGCACVTTKSYRDAAGAAAIGVVFGGPRFDQGAAAKFVNAYRTRVGFAPDYASYEVYDIVNMIATAIESNGATGKGIRDGLAKLKNFESIGGERIDMREDGQTIVPVGIYRVTDLNGPQVEEIQP